MYKFIDNLFSSGKVMEWVRILINNDFRVIKRSIKENIKDKGSVLDIGSGTGYFSRLFKNAKYIGIDSSEKYVKFANQKYGGKFFVMDAQKMLFKNCQFDSILMISFLHHIEDNVLKKILKDVKRILKEDGRLIIIDPVPVDEQENFVKKFIFSLDRGAYGRRMDQISKLLNPIFKIEKYSKINTLSCTMHLFICKNLSN